MDLHDIATINLLITLGYILLTRNGAGFPPKQYYKLLAVFAIFGCIVAPSLVLLKLTDEPCENESETEDE